MPLREAIESAVNTVEETQVPATPVVETPLVETPAQETPVAEEKPGRTAGRQRDEHGKLLPGKAERPPAPAAVPPAPAAPKMPPPSSWKKDHWQSWEKIAAENPQLAEYLNQREGEFAKGVSTYKQEYDSVKPLADAIQPFMQTLQQHGIRPEQWITNLGQAHHQLALGSPQQKLQMFAKLAQDYQVPLQALYDPQAQQQFLSQQLAQPAEPMPDVRAMVQEQFVEISARNDLEQFWQAKDASGNPLYPHYETVRNTMAQLLDANVANDLKSAYDKAIRMHDDIWEKEQAAKQAAALKSSQEAQARIVAQAKSAAVSPRSATPAADGNQAGKGSRRDTIAAAIDAHSGGGRL